MVTDEFVVWCSSCRMVPDPTSLDAWSFEGDGTLSPERMCEEKTMTLHTTTMEHVMALDVACVTCLGVKDHSFKFAYKEWSSETVDETSCLSLIA